MPPLRFITACAAVVCAVLGYLCFTALGMRANAALAFSLFGTSLAGLLFFAYRAFVVEERRRHVD
jgi:zinc transporter ZupT